MADQERWICAGGRDDPSGGDCRAGGADGANSDQRPAADVAAALAGLVDDPRLGAAGGGVAPLGPAAAIRGRAALSRERGRSTGAGRSAGTIPPGRFLAAGAGDRAGARGLRGTRLPRLHPFGFPALGAQVAGDRPQRALVWADPRHPATVANRLPGRDADRIPGRAKRQHSARHGVPSGPQHAGGCQRPDHARDVPAIAAAAVAGCSRRRRRMPILLAGGRRRRRDQPSGADVVQPASLSEVGGGILGGSDRSGPTESVAVGAGGWAVKPRS